MIRYDMICVIWYDMWYDMICDMIWYDMIWYVWYDMIYDDMWCDMIWYVIWYMWYDIWYGIFVNCNWVDTRWQQYSTHLRTNNTQNDTKQTIHRTTQNKKYTEQNKNYRLLLLFATSFFGSSRAPSSVWFFSDNLFPILSVSLLCPCFLNCICNFLSLCNTRIFFYITALLIWRSRDRFPMVSLDFSVTYFLPTVPWPWGRLSP
jgi:hypothetical protein